MAVKQPPIKMIRDYLPLFQRQMLLMMILPAIFLGVVVGSTLLLTEAFSYTSILFWLIITGATILSIIGNFIIFIYTAKPMKDLLAVIAHIAGEPTATPLPNPNSKEYQKTGFGGALQTVYELGSKAGSVATHTPAGEASTNNIASSLDRIPGAIVVLDHKRNIVFASKKAPLYSVDNALQLQLLFSKTDSLDQWLDLSDENAVKAEKVWQRIPDKPADQEDQRIFDIVASYEKGATYETVVTLIDRTDSYQDDEEDLNFIAFAAHELRGPITVIRGYLDVLEDELASSLQADQEELFHRLTVSANRLSGYINNILNTSRYDRRHLSIHLAEDTVTNVYDTIKDDMSLRAASQNRLLSVEFPDTLPTIAADRGSLGEVFGNLIDNAIKYSNEGGPISVTAAQKGDFVEVIVQDKGIGMPGNVVSNLFQKFYRSHRSRETVAGSGIGLYISKAIVESHGGTISVRSAEGEGSTFTVSIPTYASVAEKLQLSNNNNQELISQGKGWIKNHSMYRG